MALILHQLEHSPYCIPIRRLLEAHKIPYETVNVNAWDRRALITLTGGVYYQVPVIDDAGRIVHETAADPLAVPHYLDQAWLSGALFPESAAGLQELVIQHIEQELEGIGFKISDPYVMDTVTEIEDKVMILRHKERRFGAGCVEAWREQGAALLSQFEAALAPYETRLRRTRYLFGDAPVYADYALFGVLRNAQRQSVHLLSPSFTQLKRWEKDLAAHTV